MYKFEIGSHLEIEVIPNADRGKPPFIWIRDSTECENCHPNIHLKPSIIQPLNDELANVADIVTEMASERLQKVERLLINSLKIEIIHNQLPEKLGFQIPVEELPVILIFDGSIGLGGTSVITLRLSDVAPFRKALEEISGYFKADAATSLYNTGTLAMQSEDYTQAIASLKEAILLNPQHNLAAFNLAMCYDLLGQLDEALSWYQRAMDLDPNDPDPVYNIAEIHYRRKRLPQAEKLCKEALDLFQEQFKAVQFMPFPPGRQDLSIEQFLAKIAYKKAGAYHLMALIEANQGKLQQALQSIQCAIDIYPHNARWFLLMAKIHRGLGNYVEARSTLRYAMELDPSIANDVSGHISR